MLATLCAALCAVVSIEPALADKLDLTIVNQTKSDLKLVPHTWVTGRGTWTSGSWEQQPAEMLRPGETTHAVANTNINSELRFYLQVSYQLVDDPHSSVELFSTSHRGEGPFRKLIFGRKIDANVVGDRIVGSRSATARIHETEPSGYENVVNSTGGYLLPRKPPA